MSQTTRGIQLDLGRKHAQLVDWKPDGEHRVMATDAAILHHLKEVVAAE